ncbi:hypothetical protein SPRG_21281 [Saprolegnia parasitica CBS 223.65]|uniref:ELMO domain-containing protein n=1 Tax=Saprolegnia parasitica (strain CBS 223.65) TaxID=695850 RepID=A0A067C414_SAPPC|nr:hypothetical protein SPRG_21281 [Saprolegnia parasitica CBS 223.65]KDO21547.1 hypothetical protein SPRG_21281 [Saprolegnia parasitica CBS 223.65]|eukprot:XP_012207759.1 hypothetical protein SPRG_21281 [Saprolegnia parasitica CBS 223.65]
MADDATDPRPPPAPIAVAALHIDTQAIEAESLEAPLAVSPTYGVARNQVDPAVLAALPKEIQDEVLASFSVPASPSAAAPVDPSEAAWTCPMCTFLNHAALCTPSETVYEALLQELWTTVFSQSVIPGMAQPRFTRDGDGWLQLGFQRSNPDTDFRGGGLLGLKCLVYVCHMHMDKMAYIFADQVPSAGQRWYPVCVAGINLTCMLAGLLKLGDGSFAETSDNCWRLFDEPSAFYELYYYAFLKMDQIWHRSQATFMQFGDVLKATKKLVRYALAQGPTSLAELTAFTETIHVDDFKITRRQEYYDDVDDGECPDPHRITEDDGVPVTKVHDIASLQYELHK